ncbi:MAG: protoporphyrinogen oxidase HemJ [Pseudomonadota bacterium]
MLIYVWVKTLHVVAIIAWMAALLYLPRLMVYHVAAEKGSVQSETFKVMERRLLKAIGTPSMLVAWASGLTLASILGAWSQPWFQAKFTAVIGLTIMHMWMARWVKTFARDQNTRTAKFYRFMNEVPTLIMIAVVIFVIVKPF